MPPAYSYLRFSSPEQAKGDSVRRQTEATADWCRRNGATLDTSLTLRDEVVSAFRGKNRENPDVHGMAAFLAAVKTGRVPAGSFLVLENLDRLTRESIVPAVHLFTGILVSGVRVVQLKPAEQVFDAGADMTAVMLALVELSRGHSESVMKSDRIGAAWTRKRKNAATKVLTRRLPVWIKYDAGKLVFDREKVKTVRRMFRMAGAGVGLTGIARTLNEEGVPVPGRKVIASPNQAGVPKEQKIRRPVVWSASLVYRILTSRAIVGEYQPHRGTPGRRKPAGEPVCDYYPPAIDPDTFAAVQSALRTRAVVGRGRRGRHVNLFAGLLHDARTGGSLMARHHKARGSVIFPSGAAHGRGDRWVSYPFAALESAILSRLVEVKVEDVQPGEAAGNKVESLAARKAELEALVAKWRAKMDRPELVDLVADKLAELGREQREVMERLVEAQQESASPFAEAVGQLRTVGRALADDSGEENRLRCRAAVRRVVESVWCLFTPGRGLRLAAVQVWFKGGAHRDYLVTTRPGMANKNMSRPSQWRVESFADAGVKGGLDLRDRGDARALEKLLVRLDLSKLFPGRETA
jgi:DNA invertase Pin-like site-specific DNA recombinase